MALEYILKIATKIQSEEVLHIIYSHIGINADVKLADGKQVFFSDSGSGFLIYTGNIDQEDYFFFKEELGIILNTFILFRLDKFADRELVKNMIVQITNVVLTEMADDAVLLFNGEQILLFRSQGKLFINSLIDFWNSSYLDLLTISYEMKEF